MERAQAAHEKQVDEQIDVAAHRRGADGKACCQLRRVEQRALAVGQHGPEPLQRLRGDSPAELRYVALQVGADEAPPEGHAVGVVLGQKTVREAAAHPQRRHGPRVGCGLAYVEWVELDVFDSPGEALARLPEQIQRSRAQHQEAARPFAPPAALVDQPAQLLEQFRRSVNLIQNDEAVLVLAEVERRLCELLPVRAGLEVEIDGLRALGDLERQRRLADLTRPEQGDGRLPAERFQYVLICTSMYHSRKLKHILLICKDNTIIFW